MSEFIRDTGFKSVTERTKRERAYRELVSKGKLRFGVKFLDDCFGGINQNDLVVFFARTGGGKTQLGTLIAKANALEGKRVHYFALEAAENEIEQRIKYQYVRQYVKEARDPIMSNVARGLNYSDWYDLKYDEKTKLLESDLDDLIGEKLATLHTKYMDRGYKLEDFELDLRAIEQDTDLIIVDHLHYFQLDDARSENSEMTRLTMRIRELSLLLRKPIVLIVHIRKSDKKSRELAPDLDEIHGSSNVAKIATKIFSIAPAKSEIPGKYPTLIRPLKNRIDGSRTRYIGLVSYLPLEGDYEEAYQLVQLNFEGTEVSPCTTNPPWFRKPPAPEQPQLKGFTHVK